MTCHDARELFSALVDDALGAVERRALDTHLATCAECGRELQRFRGTVALLRSVEPARAPAGFVDRVLDVARPVPWPRRLLRALVLPWPVKLPVEAAAVVLVAVGVVYVFRATPELQQAAHLEPTSRTDTTRTDTTLARDVASESSRAAPAPETYRLPATSPPPATPQAPATSPPLAGTQAPPASQPPGRSQAPKEQLGEKKDAATTRSEAESPARGLSDAARDADRLKRESRPAPSAETPTAGKLAAPPARSERDRGVAQESARSGVAPTAMAVAPPDVSGRLAVADQTAALQGLAYLVDRLGAVENRRVKSDAGPIIELTIPYESYAEFVRELTRLGRWEVTKESGTLPARVRVVLQITS